MVRGPQTEPLKGIETFQVHIANESEMMRAEKREKRGVFQDGRKESSANSVPLGSACTLYFSVNQRGNIGLHISENCPDAQI